MTGQFYLQKSQFSEKERPLCELSHLKAKLSGSGPAAPKVEPKTKKKAGPEKSKQGKKKK